MTAKKLDEQIELRTLDLAMHLVLRFLQHRIGTAINENDKHAIEREVDYRVEQLRRDHVFKDLPRMYVKWENYQPRLYWQGIPDELAAWLAHGLIRGPGQP